MIFLEMILPWMHFKSFSFHNLSIYASDDFPQKEKKRDINCLGKATALTHLFLFYSLVSSFLDALTFHLACSVICINLWRVRRRFKESECCVRVCWVVIFLSRESLWALKYGNCSRSWKAFYILGLRESVAHQVCS